MHLYNRGFLHSAIMCVKSIHSCVRLNVRVAACHATCIKCRALARILKLPIIFERVPIQNGLKWAKTVQNGPKW